MKQLLRPLLLVTWALLWVTSALADPITLHIQIDTTPLATTSGYLAFDLLGGSPLQNNTSKISGFATTGTLGTSSSSGNVTGSLINPPLVLTASIFFNEFLQKITFGSSASFDLTLSSHFMPGSTPDSFSFFLLDNTLTPYDTSDPSGADALFVVDLVNSPMAAVYTSPFATVTLAIPEPATILLLASGLAGLVTMAVKNKFQGRHHNSRVSHRPTS